MKVITIFGQNVRRAREKKKMTIQKLSDISGYNRYDLSTLENGEHDVLLSTAISLAKALDEDFPLMLSRNYDAESGRYFIDNDYLAIFCENVHYKLNNKNMYQYALSSTTGIDSGNLSRIMKKEVTPKLGTLERIAGALKTDMDVLFTRRGGEAE